MTTSRLVAVSATALPWQGADRVRLHVNYVRSTEGAGLVPVVVPPLRSAADVEAILDRCGGLILTGGDDVDPALYGEVAHPTTGAPNVLRDQTELALFRGARVRRMPTLAICRGIQLVNVALGGTLVQDIPSQRPSAVAHDQQADQGVRTHRVDIEAGTRLTEALGASTMDVNSYHHQAVDRLADGLRISATAPDGLVEGVETTETDWWMVGVQWHPEDLTTDGRPWDRGLFATFARTVGAVR
jgi:putative glutamine amidotransferase